MARYSMCDSIKPRHSRRFHPPIFKKIKPENTSNDCIVDRLGSCRYPNVPYLSSRLCKDVAPEFRIDDRHEVVGVALQACGTICGISYTGIGNICKFSSLPYKQLTTAQDQSKLHNFGGRDKGTGIQILNQSFHKLNLNPKPKPFYIFNQCYAKVSCKTNGS